MSNLRNKLLPVLRALSHANNKPHICQHCKGPLLASEGRLGQARALYTAAQLILRPQVSQLDSVGSFAAAAQQRRRITVDQHGQAGEELSEKDFHRLSDLTLGEIMVKLEALIENTPSVADADLEYSQGVLTLSLGEHGTYIINKQGPNKQIWMSSPISGPVRYDFKDGRWLYTHDGHVFEERLASELKEITGRDDVDLELEPQVEKGFVGYSADPT